MPALDQQNIFHRKVFKPIPPLLFVFVLAPPFLYLLLLFLLLRSASCSPSVPWFIAPHPSSLVNRTCKEALLLFLILQHQSQHSIDSGQIQVHDALALRIVLLYRHYFYAHAFSPTITISVRLLIARQFGFCARLYSTTAATATVACFCGPIGFGTWQLFVAAVPLGAARSRCPMAGDDCTFPFAVKKAVIPRFRHLSSFYAELFLAAAVIEAFVKFWHPFALGGAT